MFMKALFVIVAVSTAAFAFEETPAHQMLPTKPHTVSLLYKSGDSASESAVKNLSNAAKRLSHSKLIFLKSDVKKNDNKAWADAAARFPFDSSSLPVLFTNIAGRFEKFSGDLTEDGFFSHVDSKIAALMGDDDDEDEYGSLLDDEEEEDPEPSQPIDQSTETQEKKNEEQSQEDREHKERTDKMWAQYADDMDPESEDVPNVVVRYTTKEDFLERCAEGPIFIKFYEEWCGWSKRIKKAYMRSALKNRKVMTFMEVECTATSKTKDFCNEHGVMGFPHFKIFHHGYNVTTFPNSHDEEGIDAYMNYWPFFLEEWARKEKEEQSKDEL